MLCMWVMWTHKHLEHLANQGVHRRGAGSWDPVGREVKAPLSANWPSWPVLEYSKWFLNEGGNDWSSEQIFDMVKPVDNTWGEHCRPLSSGEVWLVSFNCFYVIEKIILTGCTNVTNKLEPLGLPNLNKLCFDTTEPECSTSVQSSHSAQHLCKNVSSQKCFALSFNSLSSALWERVKYVCCGTKRMSLLLNKIIETKQKPP